METKDVKEANMNYNELAKRAHANAVKHGFWKYPLSNEHCIMLIITEIGELVNAHRKGDHADYRDFDVYSISTPDEFQKAFELFIKDSIEDEFADVAIRLFDLAGARLVDFNKPHKDFYRDFSARDFAENAYQLVFNLLDPSLCLDDTIRYGMQYLEAWAEWCLIDLLWYIEQKMKYNEGRPAMHGKKY